MAAYQVPSGTVLTESSSGGFQLPDGTLALEASATTADLSGSATLDDIAASGGASGPLTLGGSATLDDVGASGTVSSAPDGTLGGNAGLGSVDALGTVAGAGGVGTCTTSAFKNNAGVVTAPGTTIPWAKAIRCSDGAVVFEASNQALNGSSQLVLVSGFLVPGVKYQVVASDLTGTYYGIEPVTAV